ncbi:DUF4345 domain-containing protein [Shewanella sp. GutDb-MelDb]|jgi:hypothetical protein|uniref:DUF4345 domain-containing protein n=1 Tax=Shewanella sp. GutDb-MelDb TaxID=2058316 RepID=UPI000C7E7ADB|nr:DUF4345 domain-containing protein [Shewanella sp. GutDb-MelDb]PKG58864.1 DUF4345 domain-containing protein [Shewanella sp. GutDb-MelDb]
MTLPAKFLIFAVLGLTPIALSYGLYPPITMQFLFGIEAEGTNFTHIFRAIMGLYFANALFWLLGAYKQKYRLAALYSLVIFMFGLGAGRFLSLIIDGMPHWLLFVYLLLEIGFGVAGIYMIKKSGKEELK